MNAIPAKRSDVAPILAATFPHYRGRKIEIRPERSVTLYDLNWSGGSRNQYRSCTLDGRPTGSSDRYNAMAPWENIAEGVTLPVPSGFAVAEHVHFCGRDHGIRIYVHPSDLATLLPQAA